MALKIYADAGTTNEVLPSEVFEDEVTGSENEFVLTLITGDDVGAVYVENRTTYNTVTFTAGVSSTLTGAAYSVNELIGQRVIHNGEFRGTITGNTADTVTIDDLTYTQATASSCIVCSFTKQTLTTHYTIVGNTITFVAPPAAGKRVHVLPLDDAGLAFGDVAGNAVTASGSVWLKRESAYEYRNIKVYSQDNSVDDNVDEYAAVSCAGTSITSANFVGLTVNFYAGYAFWHDGAFRGIVVSNTATTMTLDRSYTGASGNAQFFNIGPMLVSLDDITYDYVVSPADITTDTPVRIYYKDTVTIPEVPMNYPNVTLKVTGIEYLA